MTVLSNTAPAGFEQRRDALGVAAGIALAGLSAALVLGLFWGHPINHDTAWFLIATRKWLAGAQLYIDIIEVNPPLNFYYTAPAVWLSQWTGITPANAWYAVMAALTFTTVLWCERIVARHGDLTPISRLAFAAGVAFAVIVPAFNEFGQRDHLLVLFILPWLTTKLVAAEDDAAWPGMARAAFAALGICLKPYFLVFPVCLTLLDVWRERSLKPVAAPGNLVIAGVGLVYLGLVVAFHRAYLTRIVPLGLDVYGEYGFPDRIVLLQLLTLWLVVFAGIPVARLARVAMPEIGIAMTAVAAAAISYLAQWTGYAYQAFPLACLTALCAAWVLVHQRSARVARLIAFSVLAMFAVSAKANGRYGDPALSSAAAVIAELHPAPRLLTMTTNPSWGPGLALQANADWISRYPALWTVPGIVNRLHETDCTAHPGRCARLNEVARQTRSSILEDLRAAKPDIVIVHASPGYIRVPGFTWQKFMAPEPGYAAFMRDYVEVRKIGEFSIRMKKPPN